MDTFTVRDLRERTGELIRDAEGGKLSIITKHGRPIFIAVPFDETAIQSGVNVALAIKLFQTEVFSIGKAAKFANCSVPEFNQHLAIADIPNVNYAPGDLEDELKTLG